MSIHSTELTWIQHLQNALRSGWTDSFFIAWDYVDTTWFIMTFVAVILYLFNRKEGLSLLFIFLVSSLVNMVLKNYFNWPRPCQIDPALGILCYSSSGFPSGAAQTATIIFGAAFVKCQRPLIKIGAALFSIFLCFSRVYLGLHFFTDILGGIVVGLGLLALYLKFFPRLENQWPKFAVGLAVLILLLGGVKMLSQAAMLLGIAVGLWFSKEDKLPLSWLTRWMAFFIAVIGSAAFLFLGNIYSSIGSLTSLVAGFWFVFMGNYLVLSRS